MRTEITVLTQPFSRITIWQIFKGLIKQFLIKLRILSKSGTEYGGHYAVTRSLIEGLKILNVDFNYNPEFRREVKEVVVVLANIEALKQAIELKKKGKIKKLLAGPNLMVRSHDYNKILASEEIDVIIVPSEWIKTAYEEDLPELIGRIKIWYAGVNAECWKPSKTLLEKKYIKNVLVYWKTEDESFIQRIVGLLREYNWNPILMKYGSYNQNDFKEHLEKCLFSVFISRSESQGIALLEAWSMDVPTFVWNPGYLDYNNKVYHNASAAPYLTKYTGAFWSEIDELEELLKDVDSLLVNTNPSKWISLYMNDTASAQRLLKISK